MARRTTLADRQIQARLRDAHLPTTFFNRTMVSYNCENLRTFIQFSDPFPNHIRDQLKQELCFRLARLNGGRIQVTQERFVETLRNLTAGQRHAAQHIPAPLLARARFQNAVPEQPRAQHRQEQRDVPNRVRPRIQGVEQPVFIQEPNQRGQRDRLLLAIQGFEPPVAMQAPNQCLYSAERPPLPCVALNPQPNDARVVPAAETRVCQSCLEGVPVTDFRAPPCDAQCTHRETSFCTGCFEQHIIASVDTSALNRIPCPEPNCAATLSYEQMRIHAPLRIFYRYSTYINEVALAAIHGYMECSRARCENAVIVDDPDLPDILCDACGQRTCTTCRTPWHPGLSHQANMDNLRREQEQRAATRANQEVQSEELVQQISQACPNQACGARIERDGGCEHMICVSCEHEFCWLCLDPWTEPGHICIVE